MSASREKIDHLFEASPLPSPAALAQEFSKVLGNWLAPSQLREVTLRNSRETNPNICHSHDFCDANMAMDQALKNLGAEAFPAEGGMSDEVVDLWNEAWDIAKANDFR